MAFTDDAAPLAHTAQGPVRGLRTEGVRVWRGVPFAEPPVGPLRWRAPVAARPREGVFDATAFAARSAQPPLSAMMQRAAVDAPVRLDEDSLVVNVVAPDREPPPDGFPVVFFLHGGALLTGGATVLGEAQSWAREGFVFVAAQYRLGPFGYLDLRTLDERESDSGLCGFLDQLEALRWTLDNVAAFGGDPRTITLYGGSAGAKSVAALLSSPAVDPSRIRGALLSSGTGNLVKTREMAADQTERFLRVLNRGRTAPIDTVDGLRAASTAEIVEAATALAPPSTAVWVWRPSLHETVLPEPPVSALRSGAARGVPLLAGTAADEGAFFVGDPAVRAAMIEALDRNIEWVAGEGTAEAVRAIYARRDADPELAAVAIFGDAQYTLPTVRLLDAQSTHAATWRYRLDLSVPGYASLGLPFASHGSDAPVIWGMRADPRTPGIVMEDDAAELDAAASLFRSAVLEFARTGAPGGALDWPRYDPDRRATMVVDTAPHTEDDPRADERRAWGGNDWIASEWFPTTDAADEVDPS